MKRKGRSQVGINLCAPTGRYSTAGCSAELVWYSEVSGRLPSLEILPILIFGLSGRWGLLSSPAYPSRFCGLDIGPLMTSISYKSVLLRTCTMVLHASLS